MSKWTPGPYHIHGGTLIKGPQGNTVADVRYKNGLNDARLLAAAPELYEAALKTYEGLLVRINEAPTNAVPVFDGIVELHDALAKARGEQS